ncbi:MAG: hypothetical protein CMM01_15875 [Rhodopirellula sp.]|nr:hypothetical protein [Rhodopirellula sp.]
MFESLTEQHSCQNQLRFQRVGRKSFPCNGLRIRFALLRAAPGTEHRASVHFDVDFPKQHVSFLQLSNWTA